MFWIWRGAASDQVGDLRNGSEDACLGMACCQQRSDWSLRTLNPLTETMLIVRTHTRDYVVCSRVGVALARPGTLSAHLGCRTVIG